MKPIDRIVVILFLACAAAAAQTSPSATVSGTVTDALTGLPVLGAVVRAGAAVMRTDSFGSYTLKLPAGKTSLFAFRTGYRKPGPDEEIEIHAGEALRKDFVLRPAPRISGIVTDADTGRRIKGCIVFATRRIVALGEAWFTAAGIPSGDARDGAFETSDLDPGDYILEVTQCAWSYYPGVDRIEMAAPLTVSETGISGLNIKIKTHQGRRISGVVDGNRADLTLVRHVQGETEIIAKAHAAASGEFQFDDIPSGEYSLIGSQRASQTIVVSDHDVTGLTVKPNPATPQPEIKVKAFEDGVELSVRASLTPVFPNETDLYWPRLAGMPSYAVASVLANDVPVPNGSLPLAGIARLTLLVTKDTSTLTGKAEAPHALVFAIREPFAEYLDRESLPQTASDEAGNYEIENLAPGKYKLAILTGEEKLLRHNEQFLRRKAGLAESVTVE